MGTKEGSRNFSANWDLETSAGTPRRHTQTRRGPHAGTRRPSARYRPCPTRRPPRPASAPRTAPAAPRRSPPRRPPAPGRAGPGGVGPLPTFRHPRGIAVPTPAPLPPSPGPPSRSPQGSAAPPGGGRWGGVGGGRLRVAEGGEPHPRCRRGAAPSARAVAVGPSRGSPREQRGRQRGGSGGMGRDGKGGHPPNPDPRRAPPPPPPQSPLSPSRPFRSAPRPHLNPAWNMYMRGPPGPAARGAPKMLSFLRET